MTGKGKTSRKKAKSKNGTFSRVVPKIGVRSSLCCTCRSRRLNTRQGNARRQLVRQTAGAMFSTSEQSHSQF